MEIVMMTMNPDDDKKEVGEGRSGRVSELEATAYHEAGHAVVGFFERPHSVRRVTLHWPDCLWQTTVTLLTRLRYPDAEVSARMRRRIEQQIITLLAGFQAERRFDPDANPDAG